MTQEMKEQLVKRLKSLMWRLGMMAAAVVVAFLTENLGLFGLPAWATIGLGLMLGEVSKYLNTRQDGGV